MKHSNSILVLLALLSACNAGSPGDAAAPDGSTSDGCFLAVADADACLTVVPSDAVADATDAADDAAVDGAVDASAADAPEPTDAGRDVLVVDGGGDHTACYVTFRGGSAPYQCVEWLYMHATEIPVRQMECTNLGTTLGSDRFVSTGGCDRTGSAGCCVNNDGSGATCWYAPYTPSTVQPMCMGNTTYMP